MVLPPPYTASSQLFFQVSLDLAVVVADHLHHLRRWPRSALTRKMPVAGWLLPAIQASTASAIQQR